MLGLPGHIHIIYNALAACAQKLEFMPQFLEHLSAMEEFMSTKALRNKFRVSCLGSNELLKAAFKNYSTVHIDWRWEFLSKALDRLIPLWPYMWEHWNETAMLSGETTSSDRKCVKKVTIALKTAHLIEFAEMLRVHGAVLEFYVGKLEGCWCHQVSRST